MNDQQLVAMAVAISVPLGLLFLSNSRHTDVKEALRAEIKLSENKLENRIDKLERRIETMDAKLDRKLDDILKILADHEVKLNS